jgi:hypothetical protein
MRLIVIAALFALSGCMTAGNRVAPDYNLGWRADPATEAEIAQRSGRTGLMVTPAALTDADVAQCRYEAAAATVNTRGILMPAIEEANLRDQCLRAARMRHEAR